MGPITGVRILNLRVRDKVAYPDVTLDLVGRGADHLVVGLENGGGKSTLLGAVYHVFVPEADEFLPRRAQRRQEKKGELKKLEDYVPGGDPTHFIVEIDAPTPEGSLPFAGGPRLLVGACLWKPAGAPATAPAEEFFWSARGVSPRLTLRDFEVRSRNGRLLDHVEFGAHLRLLRAELPGAQLTIETGKGAWQRHLRDMGIDVEYVRQFLLRMNEDEGAADRVFTYASSRAFLNSLVGVVGDPTAIAQLKARMLETADDATTVALDRRRVALLEGLVGHTEPLARAMSDLALRIKDRDTAVTRLLAARYLVEQQLDAARRAASECMILKEQLERALIDARSAYSDAHARYMQAKLQVAQLEARDARAAVDSAETDRTEARARERMAAASALLADRRTTDARIRELDRLLDEREREAEPLRVTLASSLKALDARLNADRDAIATEDAAHESESKQASEAYVRAIEERSEAAVALAALAAEREALDREDQEIQRQLTAAVTDGVLETRDSDSASAARLARAQVAQARARVEEHEAQRQSADRALAELHLRATELATASGRAELSVRQSREEHARAAAATGSIEEDVAASGFIEVVAVALDSDAPSVVARLQEVIDAARRRQAAASVGSAAAQRAATWLVDRERLPPRADVERVCETAQSRRLGAHPGWSYLATLPADAAAAFAGRHPGLADGIIVNVPEDLDAVARLLEESRDTLEGPVVVGPPSSFELETAIGPPAVVVLPHDAYWSRPAARDITEGRAADAARWDKDYAVATRRGEAAASLRERVLLWSRDIGSGGVQRRARLLSDAEASAATIDSERASLAREIDGQIELRRKSEVQRDEARAEATRAEARAERLAALQILQRRSAEIHDRRLVIGSLEGDATEARGAAIVRAAGAEARRNAAEARRVELALASGALEQQRRELGALASVVVRSGDVVDPGDATADRQRLAEHVRDRESRWRGAVSDPQLRSQLDVLQSEVRELDKRLRDYDDVAAAARATIETTEARAADDYRADAAAARRDVESLGERIGELKSRATQLEAEVTTVKEELRTVRRPAALTADQRADDVATARGIRDELLRQRDEAMNSRTAREGELAAATAAEARAAAQVRLLEPVPPRLLLALRALVRGTTLVPALNVLDYPPAVDVAAVLGEATLPAWLSALVRLHEVSSFLEPDVTAPARALEEIDMDVEHLQGRLGDLENVANAALEAMEALLRDASEDVVKNDRMIQMFRSAQRRTLADLAGRHHGDVMQRLEATRHHVATFDARLEALGETVYATVADLLREVRQTVRDSQLPNTPAMGHWAGSDLLKLGGLDSLKTDEKKAAIAALLRGWFDPEHPENRTRRFDGDEVVHDLLKAVAPQFTARILIPSDPLDPEHMSVEHLARETSGGEGVAVALIMASLLASRRASMRGHRRTTLMLDNPFAKVTKPEFLRLARDVATELRVQLVMFTGIRDIAALAVFPRLTQLRVSRRQNANFVVPQGIDDERLQPLLRDGTLFVSPMERAAAESDGPGTWPVMSSVSVVDNGPSDDGRS